MKRRQWHIAALALSVLLFVLTFLTIGGFVRDRRAARDVQFGIEELDILVDDGVLAEARAMLPWLAERARTASAALRVARRAREVSAQTGDNELFARVAEILSTEFSGNTALRELLIYALVRSDDLERAFDQAQVLMDQTGDDLFFSWVLVQMTETIPLAETPGGGVDENGALRPDLLLASLNRSSSPDEFVRAWNASGRWEYAHLATVLFMQQGELDSAAAITAEASLDRWSPLLSYDVQMARGDFAAAERALRQADDSSRALLMRTADLGLYTARPAVATRAYATLERALGDGVPYHVYVNRAWLTADSRQAEELLRQAVDRYPGQWVVREQLARFLSASDPQEAVAVLAGSDGLQESVRARLLRLRLGDGPSRRGFEAALWQLLEGDPGESVERYAAWYFSGAGAPGDLEQVLDRAGHEPWTDVYRGVLHARAGRWAEAAEQFRGSFVTEPSAPAAYNEAIALIRTGYVENARDVLEDALLLAGDDGRMRVDALVARARIEPDEMVARDFVQQAKLIAPSDPEVLLLEPKTGRASGPR